MMSSIQKRERVSTPTKTTHELNLIETACLNALAGEKSYPGGIDEFHARVDPASVLELVHIAKSVLSDEELHELAQLMEEMTLYIKLVPDDKAAAKSIDRDDLILRARQVRSVLGI